MNDFVLKQVERKEEAEEVPDDVIVNNKDEELSSEGDSEDDSAEDSDADEISSNDTDIENTDSVLHWCVMVIWSSDKCFLKFNENFMLA